MPDEQNELEIAIQAYIAAFTDVLQSHARSQLTGRHYTGSKITLDREEGVLVATILADETYFTLRRDGNNWEIYEKDTEDSQIYPADKENFEGFKQIIESAEWEVDDNTETVEELLADDAGERSQTEIDEEFSQQGLPTPIVSDFQPQISEDEAASE